MILWTKPCDFWVADIPEGKTHQAEMWDPWWVTFHLSCGFFGHRTVMRRSSIRLVSVDVWPVDLPVHLFPGGQRRLDTGSLDFFHGKTLLLPWQLALSFLPFSWMTFFFIPTAIIIIPINKKQRSAHCITQWPGPNSFRSNAQMSCKYWYWSPLTRSHVEESKCG